MMEDSHPRNEIGNYHGLYVSYCEENNNLICKGYFNNGKHVGYWIWSSPINFNINERLYYIV